MAKRPKSSYAKRRKGRTASKQNRIVSMLTSPPGLTAIVSVLVVILFILISPNQNTPQSVTTGQSSLSLYSGSGELVNVAINTRNGASIQIQGFDLESNCVTYVLRDAGYDVSENVWINPDQVIPLLEQDYERNLQATTLTYEFINGRLQSLPVGTLVVFYTQEQSGLVAQHIAVHRGDGLLDQEFGFYDEVESLPLLEVIGRLADEEADIQNGHIELWVPR